MENARAPRQWLAFLGGWILFWCFMFLVCPALNRTFVTMDQIAQVIDEHNLRTGMFFYTDVEVTGDAGVETRSSIRFGPHGVKRSSSMVQD
ncbi:MAG: hypothetical protein WHS46_03500 [Desulfosoma sp.]